jgi:hypothetical protein
MHVECMSENWECVVSASGVRVESMKSAWGRHVEGMWYTCVRHRSGRDEAWGKRG